jgi:hypothetical protein
MQPNLAPQAFITRKGSGATFTRSGSDNVSESGSHVGSHAPSALSAMLGFRTNDSVASLSTPRARVDVSQVRERPTRSMARLDPANLSVSMRRSLSAAKRRDRSAERGRASPSPGPGAARAPSARSASPQVSSGRGSRGPSPGRGSQRGARARTAGRPERSFFSFRSCMSLESTTEAMDQDLCARMMRENLSSKGRALPRDLFAEFVVLKDTLDASGGCQVGFGGLGLLRRHVLRGQVDTETMLVVEVEFCTQGRVAGNPEEHAYYKHYMALCDAIETALYPTWNLSFVIKKGKPRSGAFEVSLLWLVGSVECSTTLYSKLCTRALPNVAALTARVACALEGPEADDDEWGHQEGEPGQEEEGAWGHAEKARVNSMVMRWNSEASPPPATSPDAPPFTNPHDAGASAE